MGFNSDHALGRTRTVFAKVETAFKTFLKPAATDAIKVLECKIGYKQERKDREDSRQTRSLVERITGRKEITWSLEGYLIPSGTAATPPDMGVLIKAAMGVQTIGATVVYSLAETQSGLDPLSISEATTSVLGRACFGAWTDKMTLKVSGADDPMIGFEGRACGYIQTGTSTANGAGVATTALIVQTADISNFQVGSVLQIGAAQTNRQVTVKSGANLTLDSVATWSDTDAVIPYVPAETTIGSPIAGINGSITIDAVTLPITAFELTLENGIKAVDDEAFADAPTDFIVGWRKVTGNISVRARKDMILHIGKRVQDIATTRDLVVVFGTGTGTRFQVDIDRAEMEFGDLEIPRADEATYTLPFTALATSAGGNEFTLTHL